MGLFDKLRSKAETAALPSEPKTIYVPIKGRVMPLTEIDDPVFSAGILGQGCGIEPEGESVFAPFTGTVIQVTDTRHAIGVRSADGMEVMIHVGMDTVDMNGKGFTCYVKEGSKVIRGQKLLDFSISEIRAAGHPITTAVVLCNGDEAGTPEQPEPGMADVGDVLMRVG